MDFGAYIFEQTIKHAKTDVVKFPIAFPTLLCNIILDQYPSIKTPNISCLMRIMFQSLLGHLEVLLLQV